MVMATGEGPQPVGNQGVGDGMRETGGDNGRWYERKGERAMHQSIVFALT
jgi:hypothetical protein